MLFRKPSPTIELHGKCLEILDGCATLPSGETVKMMQAVPQVRTSCLEAVLLLKSSVERHVCSHFASSIAHCSVSICGIKYMHAIQYI